MERRSRKTRIGRVVSNKMDKTVVVAVEWRQPHPIYKKSVKRVTKFHAHDVDNRCKVGDLVSIMETRPLSKTKRWRVTEILSTGEIPELPSEDLVGAPDDAEEDDEGVVENEDEAEEES
ncbi:MAG: 30S ribosomal protein S17 [Chloroflexi bacterium]|nr:30S ribosomal protein S17 [Chloroflexota bacterium]